MPALLPSPRLLTDGLTMVESGRWHEGRLWFAHWGSGEVIAVDLEGRRDVAGPGRDGMGWSIAWLPDGRLLVSGEELTRVEPDGSAGTVSRAVTSSSSTRLATSMSMAPTSTSSAAAHPSPGGFA